MAEIAAVSSAAPPPAPPCSQQFVYGTLFAKLIFPPFKWEPQSEREGGAEGRSGKAAAAVDEERGGERRPL